MAWYELASNAGNANDSITRKGSPLCPGLEKRQSVLSNVGGISPCAPACCPGRPFEIVQNSSGPAHTILPSPAPHTVASWCQETPLYSHTPGLIVGGLPELISAPR